MSLQALPTELDVRIIELLNVADRSQITRVSKYYRKVSEPLLYHTISVFDTEHDRIKLLLTTFLSRKDLRPLLKRFSLFQDANNPHDPLNPPPQMHHAVSYHPSREGSALCDRLWSYMPAIRDALESLAARFNLDHEYRTIWFSKVFQPFPYFDGALSLLLCLVPEVTYIHLELSALHPLPVTLALFGNQMSMIDEAAQQFWQLDTFRLYHLGGYESSSRVMVQPGLRDLKIYGGCNCPTVPMRSQVNTSALGALYFHNVDLDPNVLEATIKSSWLSNLKFFRVYGVGSSGAFHHVYPPSVYDYRRLQQAMLEHLPLLEQFAWMDMARISCAKRTLVPFASFASFPRLKDLGLDYDLVIRAPAEGSPQDHVPDLAGTTDYFPAQLDFLDIGDIGWKLVKLMYAAHLETSKTRSDVAGGLQRLIASFPMKELRVSINLQDWPHSTIDSESRSFAMNEPAVHLLRSLVDTLFRVGITLKVDYYMCDAGESCRMLVRPGMTATRVYYDTYRDAMRKRGLGEADIEAQDAALYGDSEEDQAATEGM